MTHLIRPAVPADTPALADLLRSLAEFPRFALADPAATLEQVRRQLALDLADDSHLLLVAEAPDGGLAAYAAVHWLPYLLFDGPEGYVSELFVRHGCRGQGIGARLLDEIKTAAKARGCSRLMLLNMRRRQSYQRQFYLKQGWEERPDAANFILMLD